MLPTCEIKLHQVIGNISYYNLYACIIGWFIKAEIGKGWLYVSEFKFWKKGLPSMRLLKFLSHLEIKIEHIVSIPLGKVCMVAKGMEIICIQSQE